MRTMIERRRLDPEPDVLDLRVVMQVGRATKTVLERPGLSCTQTAYDVACMAADALGRRVHGVPVLYRNGTRLRSNLPLYDQVEDGDVLEFGVLRAGVDFRRNL